MPLLALGYGILLATLLYAVNQVTATESEGPWFELAGVSALGLSILTTALLGATAWRRHRDGLRRAWAWALAAGGSGLVGVAAILLLTLLGQLTGLLNGADVRATRPVLHALPHPPSATLLGEHPGPAQTESITDEFRVAHLDEVAPFYREALTRAGWTEDRSAAGPFLVFRKGEFAVSILAELPGAGGPTGPGRFSVTVDHVRRTETPSPPATTPASR